MRQRATWGKSRTKVEEARELLAGVMLAHVPVTESWNSSLNRGIIGVFYFMVINSFLIGFRWSSMISNPNAYFSLLWFAEWYLLVAMRYVCPRCFRTSLFEICICFLPFDCEASNGSKRIFPTFFRRLFSAPQMGWRKPATSFSNTYNG